MPPLQNVLLLAVAAIGLIFIIFLELKKVTLGFEVYSSKFSFTRILKVGPSASFNFPLVESEGHMSRLAQ